LDALNRGRA